MTDLLVREFTLNLLLNTSSLPIFCKMTDHLVREFTLELALEHLVLADFLQKMAAHQSVSVNVSA
jgi:hypothetical protein